MIFTTVSSPEEISQIFDIQNANLKTNLPEHVKASQGFLTVKHDPDLFTRMNAANPTIIALSEPASEGVDSGSDAKRGEVAGYCVMMVREFLVDTPILQNFSDRIMALSYRGVPLSSNPRWFVMGQIAVKEGFRGQGVVDGMYHKMREVYRDWYDFIVTEVSEKNQRSLKAHLRVGWKDLLVYQNAETRETWHLIVWDIAEDAAKDASIV